MRKQLGAALLVLVAGVGLSACGKQSSTTKTLGVMSGNVISTLDSGTAADAYSGQTIADTVSGLYRYDGKTLKPDMATKMATVSKDHLTYTFHLRSDAKWSDGKAVTAQDFVYAWRRVVAPKTKSQYAYIMSGIKNADAIMAGKRSATTLGAKALDKHTFQVQLERPMPYFEGLTTLYTFSPIERGQVEKSGSKYGATLKSLTFNGPYLLKQWSGSATSWVEVKNPKYWNAKDVKIKRIKYQVVKENSTALNLYASNKLQDITLSGQTAASKQKQADYNTVKQNTTTFLELNQQRVAGFKNAKIRQALSMALNRQQFIKKVLADGSTPIKQVVPSKMAYQNGQDFATTASNGVSQYTDYDLTKAKQLFKAGMKEAGLTSMNFTLTGYDGETAKATLEYLQAAFNSLSQSGAQVKVSTQSLPFKSVFQQASEGKLDMIVVNWSADFSDPISFLDLFTSNNSYNWGKWHNAKYDALIKASKTTDANSNAKRWQDLVQATQLLTKDMGTIPLYQNGEAHLTKASVKNLQRTPNTSLDYIGASYK